MSATTTTYRSIIREINRSSVAPRATRNKAIASSFRAFFEKQRDGQEKDRFEHDMQNALTFWRSQRIHKELLERYNPLHDLTPEERIKATARRVGLDMPVEGKGENS